jgi:hypothetical protein
VGFVSAVAVTVALIIVISAAPTALQSNSFLKPFMVDLLVSAGAVSL